MRQSSQAIVFTERDQYGWTKQHVFCCSYCSVLVTSYESFKSHMLTNHNAQRVRPLFPCPECNYVSETQTDLDSHISVHKSSHKHQCPSNHCYFISEEPQAITDHLLHDCKTNTDPSSVQMSMCSKCHFVAWDSNTFSEHLKQHVEDKEKTASPKKKGEHFIS